MSITVSDSCTPSRPSKTIAVQKRRHLFFLLFLFFYSSSSLCWAIFSVYQTESSQGSNIMKILIMWSFFSLTYFFFFFNVGSWDCQYCSHNERHTSAAQHQLSVCMLFPQHFAANEIADFFVFCWQKVLGITLLLLQVKASEQVINAERGNQ